MKILFYLNLWPKKKWYYHLGYYSWELLHFGQNQLYLSKKMKQTTENLLLIKKRTQIRTNKVKQTAVSMKLPLGPPYILILALFSCTSHKSKLKIHNSMHVILSLFFSLSLVKLVEMHVRPLSLTQIAQTKSSFRIKL